jgi:eukaryotic-like serine/threonine-protein kinase
MTSTSASAPAMSRKMIKRALWGAAQSEAESRAFLQQRVTLLYKIMFWSLVALMVFLAAMYETHPLETAPDDRVYVYIAASFGFVAMAFCWRALLVRRQLSVETLYRLDFAYSAGIGAMFGASAIWQSDLPASGYLSVVYSTFTVFARALIVPSSARRTFWVSVLTFTPMTAAALVLSHDNKDMPPAMYVVGYMLFSIGPILLATLGSQIIYGLRQEATAAQQLGQYTLDKKIGEGGNGAVYLAHHVLLRRPTAVKLVLPERVGADTLARFEREVQHMSQLTHPNTVAVYDYGRSPDGVFYYAMEYLGGGIDLDRLVQTHGPQPSGRVAHILAQVCSALDEAHRANLVHRDIKPANIILCERGGVPDVPKVVDYGLVKEITAKESGQTAQVILGTPAYIAPEAITDPTSIGPAVDIYAIGAVGYFMLTGRRVFEGKTSLDICIQHVTKPVKAPSAVVAHFIAPELEAVLLRCLAKSPEDRYRSVAELAEALRVLANGTDWNDAQAREWWRGYREVSRQVQDATLPATRTITVELGENRLPGAT